MACALLLAAPAALTRQVASAPAQKAAPAQQRAAPPAQQRAAPPAQKAAPGPAPKPAPPARLKEQIEALLATPDAARALWGVEVVSLDNGQTLYAQDEHKLFIPASNMKLFTAALALSTLGPQFRFRTTVEAAAAPGKDGRVAGDLWLVGRGDPNLSARLLPFKIRTEREGSPLQAIETLADEVVRKGLRRVEGDLVADDTYFVFENFGEGWAADDLLWWYGAPVSALSVNDSVLFLEVLPGPKAGDRALIKLDPLPDYYRVENRVVTVAAARTARGAPARGEGEAAPVRRIEIDRQPGSDTLEVWGAIPQDDAGVREQVAVQDPALFAGRALREALAQRGVTVSGRVRAEHAYRWLFDDLRNPAPPAPAANRLVLAARDSLPLAENLKVAVKVSQNLHAEMVLRTVARERRGIGSVPAAMDEMRALLTAAGVSPQEYDFYDASGLSRKNLVSPAAMVALLQFMDKQPNAEAWHELLPVAGVDGSLSGRLRDTAAAGRVQAKTGTLAHIAALSGYTTNAGGERVAFSVFVNNHNLSSRAAEALLDRIALAITESK